jgi:hypothetical protein
MLWAMGPTVAGIATDGAGQVVLWHCKIASHKNFDKLIDLPMARPTIALAMLIFGTAMAWSPAALAQADIPASERLAQAPVPPTPPAAPAPPAASPPAAAGTTQAAADPIGSVATLQGTASATRSNKANALALRDSIFKGDVLQTGVDGTLGITFDDETTFTLKPNSQITVDDFVYEEGGSKNAAVFNILRGTVAFVAAEVAHTGNMKIDTPTSSLGIRGTTGLVEIPADGAGGTGQVSVKLYPDADGRVGRIEVFGRDGSQLGILTRGASGFAIRAGAGGQRFSAVPLQISAQEAERDRSFVRQAFSTRLIGRQINTQRRTLQQQHRNQLRPNQQRPNLQRPGQQLPGREQRPGLQQPGRQQLPGLQPRPGQPGAPGARPMLQRQPGALPGPRAPAGPRKPAKKQQQGR